MILFANLWQVAGSLMYWFGYGPWCLVGGRFVAGKKDVCVDLN